MEMIVGFGSTEKDIKDKIYSKVAKKIKEIYYKNHKSDYEFWKEKDLVELNEWFSGVEYKIRENYEKSENLPKDEKPERYYKISDFNSAIGGDVLFVRIGYWFINSQHPLSPDGMALLQQVETYSFSTFNNLN